ncbi:DUF3426 domain-containing protein [Achromobacter xylosoxidans]
MALTTRCPQCGTSFKVVPDQLRVRNGLVRCGACATVFDGRACLLPEAGAGMPAAGAAPAIPVSNAPIAPPAPVAPQTIAAPVLATPPAPSVGDEAPPPVRRASVGPREVAPWDELPDEPASPGAYPGAIGASPAAAPPVAPIDEPAPRPFAPAVPPAVLRGRDDIRRRIEPDAALAEEGDDDEDENEDLDRYDGEPRLGHAPPRWPAPAAPRDEPIVTRHDGANREASRHVGPAEPILGDTRTRYSSATDVGRAPPEFLDQDRQERHGLLRKLWGYACLIGLLALGLQLLYVYRIDIANSVPALRPALEAACKPLGCTVGYARRLERIAISSSSLQPPTGAAAIDDGRTRLVLNLVLRNRYDKPQHWPALVLDLTDLSDTVVVRRVLMPENYLTPEQLRGPFGPAGELKISVPIEVTGVQVNGYQLDKFFP